MPKVTVLMPVYNVGAYVTKAIRSILRQTYSDFVLLIMDDCSTDDTAARIQRFNDARIRYVRNERNLGLADNLNRGLSLIDTEYVARFDGDDIAEPDWLDANMQVLEAHPEIGICSSGFQWFGSRKGTIFYPEHHKDSMCQMLFGCTVIAPVFRKAILDDHHIRYKSSAFPAEDYQLWAECYRVTQVYNIQKVLFRYRMHPSQISTSLRQAQIEKTREVQRYMLEWLNPAILEEDIRYFFDVFAHRNTQCFDNQSQWGQFINRMLEYNTLGHFDPTALEKRLRAQSVIQYSRKQQFKQLLKRKIDHFLHPIKGEIWMLHRVTEHKSNVPEMQPYEITPERLDELLSQYQQRGYRFVSLDELYTMHQTKRYRRRPFVCVTLDDGYLDNMTEALPVFRKYQCPFCIYMTSGFADNTAECWWYASEKVPFLTATQLRELTAEPLCTIGAHTITHPQLTQLCSEDKRQEIIGSKQRLEQILHIPVHHFAYPHGDFNEECEQIVRQAGFHTAVAAWGGGLRSNHNRLALPRIKKE